MSEHASPIQPSVWAAMMALFALALGGCIPMSTPTTARMLPKGTTARGVSFDVLDGEILNATVVAPAVAHRHGISDDVEVGGRAFATVLPLLGVVAIVSAEGDAKYSLLQSEVVALAVNPTLVGMVTSGYGLLSDNVHTSTVGCFHMPLLARLGGDALAVAMSAGPSACAVRRTSDHSEAAAGWRATMGVEVGIKQMRIRPELIVIRTGLREGAESIGGGLLVHFH